MLDELIRWFLNPLGVDTAVHNSLSELMMAKMVEPHLSIRGAKKWGILDLSTSAHYDLLAAPGNLFINGLSYVIYHLKVCIWQVTAWNLFLIRGKGYDDFIPLFTTSLNAKPETIIRMYNERKSIVQTFKELELYLKRKN